MQYSLSEARSWVRDNFKGYFTVLYTPFFTDGSIDESGLRHNVEMTLRVPGVGGIIVNSIHQEFWTLSERERKRVVEIVLEAVDKRVPVVIGCSDNVIENVISYAQHAKDCNADAVMVWPPYYGVRTPQGVEDFYHKVAEKIDIGMFVYSTTLAELGFYLTPDMVQRLLSIDHLCAVMSTTLNTAGFAAMLERVGNKVCVTTSLEENFLFGKMAFPDRASNFMFGSSRLLFVQSPQNPVCGDFIRAVEQHDYLHASALLRQIIAVADQLQSRYFAKGYHNIGLSKSLTALLGMKAGAVRPPLSEPSSSELEDCAAILRNAGLII